MGLPHCPRGFDNGIWIRKLAGGELGMNLFAIDRDLKRAATRRHQFERTDVLLELEQFVRQTDGLRLVVSSGAILDGDVQRHKPIFRQRKKPLLTGQGRFCRTPFPGGIRNV